MTFSPLCFSSDLLCYVCTWKRSPNDPGDGALISLDGVWVIGLHPHRQHGDLAFPKKGLCCVQESSPEVDGPLPGAEETWTMFAEHSIMWLPFWGTGLVLEEVRCTDVLGQVQ